VPGVRQPGWEEKPSRAPDTSFQNGMIDMRMAFTGCVVFALVCCLALVLPAAAVDSGKIAFVSSRDGNNEIYVMNPDGSNIIRLTNNPAADFTPAWSPDGTKIAFASNRDGNSKIYVMNTDGSSPTRLTNEQADDYDPAWSPSGTKIAFVRETGAGELTAGQYRSRSLDHGSGAPWNGVCQLPFPWGVGE